MRMQIAAEMAVIVHLETLAELGKRMLRKLEDHRPRRQCFLNSRNELSVGAERRGVVRVIGKQERRNLVEKAGRRHRPENG